MTPHPGSRKPAAVHWGWLPLESQAQSQPIDAAVELISRSTIGRHKLLNSLQIVGQDIECFFTLEEISKVIGQYG